MTLVTWLAFVAATLILLFSPGPTVLLVISYALSRGRKVALRVAAGVGLGDFVAMTLSLAGLGALLATSAGLFVVLKWVGAGYLVYLGLRLWRSPPVLGNADAAPKSERGIFGHAFIVTALNPKSIAFFIAFVPQFIDHASPLLLQLVIMEATFVCLAVTNAIVYALAADQLRRRIRRPGVLKWINRGGGACLLGMGAATAAIGRN